MYMHAYQSLVWNAIASKRIKEHGLKLLEGDLIFTNDVQTAQEIIDDEVTANDDDATDSKPIDDETEKTAETLSRFKTMVRPLTLADIESGNFTVFDIVLPLPGHDITYPSNECAQWYADRLADDELTSEKLKQKHK